MGEDYETPPPEFVPDQERRRVLLQTDQAGLGEQLQALKAPRRAAAACALVAAALGTLGLVGRLTGHFLLASFYKGYKVMVPAVGLALALAGAAIVLLILPRRTPQGVVRVLAYLVLVISAVRMLEARRDWSPT